jgi:hypothetical protein
MIFLCEMFLVIDVKTGRFVLASIVTWSITVGNIKTMPTRGKMGVFETYLALLQHPSF